VEDFVIAPYSSGEVIAYLASNGRRLWTDAISQRGRFTPISEINDIGSRPVLAGGLVLCVQPVGHHDRHRWTQRPARLVQADRIRPASGRHRRADVRDRNGWSAGLPQLYFRRSLLGRPVAASSRRTEKKKKRISYSGPVVASDRMLVVSSTGRLLAFSPQTGEEVGSLKLGDRVYLEPIAAQDKLFILTDDAKLIAIK
jgi:outer membrane protein assembly factor BamB